MWIAVHRGARLGLPRRPVNRTATEHQPQAPTVLRVPSTSVAGGGDHDGTAVEHRTHTGSRPTRHRHLSRDAGGGNELVQHQRPSGCTRRGVRPERAGTGSGAAAFLVAYAGLLPGAGRLVDVRGRGPVFLAGVIAFAPGSVVCAAAGTIWLMMLGRIIQGIGAALSAPAALALITEGLPAGVARNKAVALYGSMGAAGFSVGLVVPGIVVSLVGWRASFLVVLPVVLVVAVAAWPLRGLRGSRDRELDLAGTTLLTGAMMLADCPVEVVRSPGIFASCVRASMVANSSVRPTNP
ncbi:MFS transporter [Occultella glacieicola]|uniref:MFS transporter n=1 Tax=Occultella glacieicola TaxID=2518684 RepID=A0ABY2E8M7_9MICO|nr:MFS transporter [Occultella glacieicola]TDE98864.1 MFS transporter [Occultella glacieicola]